MRGWRQTGCSSRLLQVPYRRNVDLRSSRFEHFGPPATLAARGPPAPDEQERVERRPSPEPEGIGLAPLLQQELPPVHPWLPRRRPVHLAVRCLELQIAGEHDPAPRTLHGAVRRL